MDLTISWWGVGLAAASMFVIGALWFGVLFAKPWQRAARVTDEQLERGMPAVFGGSFALALVAAASLGLLIGGEGALFGAVAGLATGVTLVGAFLGVVYLFERRPPVHFAINGGYATIAFTVMGAILGAAQAGG